MRIVGFLCLLIWLTACLGPTKDIVLYPNTQNSPSLFLIRFTLDKALPANSYLLVAMDWYTSDVLPRNCILVNSSISTSCTNLASPTFALTVSAAQFSSFNSKLSTNKIVAVLVNSNLQVNTTYSLQVHLFNVVPNI